jgi:hypothetical protein
MALLSRWRTLRIPETKGKVMMTRVLRITALAILLCGSAAALQAQSPGCQDVQFSAEVLARFPNAQDSCLDVIHRGGESYAVFKAQLQDVRGSTVRVRVKKRDGTYGASTSFPTKPGRKVLIDGKPYPVSELAPDQEITAYVRVDKPLIALEPVAESDPVDAAPMAEPQESQPVRLSSAAATMPHTASALGVLVLFAEFSLGVAVTLAVMRKLRN